MGIHGSNDQSFMEDTLTSFPWVPIGYLLLLAMASHRYDQPPVSK